MKICCPACGCVCVSNVELSIGQNLQCPYCNSIFSHTVEHVATAQNGSSHMQSRDSKSLQAATINSKEYLIIFGMLAFFLMFGIGCIFLCSRQHRKEMTNQAIAAFEKSNLQEGVRLSQDADRNNPSIQVWLGFCYMLGLGGLVEDHETGFEWYQKSALQGDKRGQASLARCYYRGIGTAQNYAKAVEWYRRSAEQGWGPGQYALGVCLYEGQGVRRDLQEAAKWWKKAVEQDMEDAQYLQDAQYRLGVCYIKGEGVEQNAVIGVEWLKKAVEKDHVVAQRVLGDCYRHGVGVSRNIEEAKRWYGKAVEQKDEEARMALCSLEEEEEKINEEHMRVFRELQEEEQRRQKEEEKKRRVQDEIAAAKKRQEEIREAEEERKRRYPIEQAERAKYAEAKLTDISFDMNSYFYMQDAAERYLYSATVTERKWATLKKMQKSRNWLGMLGEMADCEMKDYPSTDEIDGYVMRLITTRFHAEFLFTHRGYGSWFSMVAGEFVFAEDGFVACDLVSNCGESDFENGSLIVGFTLSDKKTRFVYATHSVPDEESCLNERKEKMDKIDEDLRLGRITDGMAEDMRQHVREEFERSFTKWLVTSRIPNRAFTEKIR